MSRYEITARNTDNAVIVGYDRPMRTYFGQVFSKPYASAGFENVIYWIGTHFEEVSSIPALKAQMALMLVRSPLRRS